MPNVRQLARDAAEEERASARAIAKASARSGALQAVGLFKLINRLLFNFQLIPILTFMLIAAVTVLLEVFFDVLVPQLGARSRSGFLAGVVCMIAAFVFLWCILRSFIYLAVDPFHAVEHAGLLRKVNRLGVRITLGLAMVEAVCAALLLRYAISVQWTFVGYAQHIMVAIVVQIGTAAACVLGSGMTLSHVVDAARHGKMSLASQASLSTWRLALDRGKQVGLLCCLGSAWANYAQCGAAAPALGAALISLFGQVLAFAAMWFGCELLLLVRYWLRSLLYAGTWLRMVATLALAGWTATMLDAFVPVVFVVGAALMSAAYFHFVVRSDEAAAAAAAAGVGVAEGDQAGEVLYDARHDAMRIMALVKALIFLILTAVAVLLLLTARQVWLAAETPPVYTVVEPQASRGTVRLTHEGFGHPQSTTHLRFAGASEGGPASGSSAGSTRGTHGMCSVRPGGLDLNLFDVGLMAQFAYVNPTEVDFGNFVRLLYAVPGDDWRVSVHAPVSRSHGVWFSEFRSARRNLAVLAIRGTNPDVLWDVVQDLDLWNVAALLQLAVRLPTSLSLWPTDVLSEVAWFVEWLDALFEPSSVSNPHRHYYTPVLERVLALEREGARVVLTGHSLGGGLAKIVGAQRNHTAVSLSGPGLLLSRRKLGISLEALQEHTISFVPTNDIVPRIDIQTGLVVEFACPYRSAVLCHDPMMTLCYIFDRCGSVLYPSMRACEFAPWEV